MDPDILAQRLGAVESRLARVEALLQSVSGQLGQARLDAEASKEAIKGWVTEYVSLRLTQLVPEACEHLLEAETAEGPVLPGTRICCTGEVVHRLGRIPIPFVREMVTQKVAEAARAEGVGVVDIAFFERAATF